MFTTTNRKRIRDYPPCYRCQERLPECHGSCERYQDWRKQLDKQNERERDAKKGAMIIKPSWVVRDINQKTKGRKP